MNQLTDAFREDIGAKIKSYRDKTRLSQTTYGMPAFLIVLLSAERKIKAKRERKLGFRHSQKSSINPVKGAWDY